MVATIISVEPNISREENDKRLEAVKEVLEEIARSLRRKKGA